MELQKRKYQDDCLDAILAAYGEGIHQQLVVMATGTGKAVLIGRLYGTVAHMFKRLPRMLVFAHREELVNQLVQTMRDINPLLTVGKEMAADYADDNCDIVVSCVASIGREGATRLTRFGNFDIVVCDEAHHSIAQTYLNVFEATGVLRPESQRLLVGFTATPKRKNLNRKEKKQIKTLDDEQILQLSSVYNKIVFTYPIRKAIKEGWLSPLKGFRVKTDTSLDNVKVTAGDFQQDELEGTVNTPERNLRIVKAWLENMEGRQSIGFTAGIQHANDLAEMFRKHDVKAEAIWGVDPERHEHSKCDLCGDYSTKETAGRSCNRNVYGHYCHGVRVYNKGKRLRHRDKDITVLLNAQLLTEGYDDWRVRCIISAAPTTNPSKFTQEVGRGTRIQEGIGNLIDAIAAGRELDKTDCYILDVVDNYKKNSLVTFPSMLGLSPDMDLQGMDIVEAAETVEALQDKYPGVDFTKLIDIKNVKAYIESIDMFAAPYTEEVKEFSKLSWMYTQDGSYVLAIPEKRDLAASKQYSRFLHEKLHVSQNELEEFELSISSTETERKLGVYSTLQEAFASADEVIQRCRGDRMKLMVREAEWHSGPASEASKKYLRHLTKKKPLLKCICAGLHPMHGVPCGSCGKETGITAGQAALALNVLHAK